MTTEVKVPNIGDFAEVEVIELMVKVGDTIKVDQSLITVESDKAALEVTQKKLGELKKALGQAKAAAAGGKDGAGTKKKRERLLLKTAKVRWVPGSHPP